MPKGSLQTHRLPVTTFHVMGSLVVLRDSCQYAVSSTSHLPHMHRRTGTVHVPLATEVPFEALTPAVSRARTGSMSEWLQPRQVTH